MPGKGPTGRGKRAPGFGGFKAPPATDLIDQLLLENDQDSSKKKTPKVTEQRQRPGKNPTPFGGFKAPKSDMIDKLLLSGENLEDADDNESLRDDGRPAKLKQNLNQDDRLSRI